MGTTTTTWATTTTTTTTTTRANAGASAKNAKSVRNKNRLLDTQCALLRKIEQVFFDVDLFGTIICDTIYTLGVVRHTNLLNHVLLLFFIIFLPVYINRRTERAK